MNPKLLQRLDQASAAVLWLWVGMALAMALLVAPVVFQTVPSRDLAGLTMGRVLGRLDAASWIAFGFPLLTSGGVRVLMGIRDAEIIGPLRLWNATILAALLIGMASVLVVTPALESRRARMNGPIETLAATHPDRLAYGKAHGVSRQLLLLRMMLAAGLALGLSALPKAQTPSA